MADSELRAKGRAMRRKLVGDVCADKLDTEVYTDPHMEKFGEVTQEVLFAQLWTRPGLDLKTRSMITLISDVTQDATDALRLHVRFCLIHGWTEDEVAEAIIHCWPYVGIPKSRASLVAASAVFKEMREEAARAAR